MLGALYSMMRYGSRLAQTVMPYSEPSTLASRGIVEQQYRQHVLVAIAYAVGLLIVHG